MQNLIEILFCRLVRANNSFENDKLIATHRCKHRIPPFKCDTAPICNLINVERKKGIIYGAISGARVPRLNKMNLRFTRVASDISAIAGHLIFSLSLLTGVARRFITRGGKKPPVMKGGRPHSLGDIFFLNSFARGLFISHYGANETRNGAKPGGCEVQSVPSRLPFYISNGDFTASVARL